MVASLSRSALSDLRRRRSRDEIEEYLDRVGLQFADLLAAALNRTATQAWERFAATLGPIPETLTAAGDFTVFADVAAYWSETVTEEIVPTLSRLYLEGSLGAWVGSPITAGLPSATAATWVAIINQGAADYARSASNRLVGVGDTVWKDLAERAGRAIEQGLSTERLKQEIEQVTKFSEYRADTIARTEVGKAFVAGDYAAAKALGEFGPVEKVWIAVMDDRTRDSHAELHETWVPFDEPFDVGGSPMMMPLDDAGPAEEVVNCRCYLEELYPGDTRPDGSVVPEPGVNGDQGEGVDDDEFDGDEAQPIDEG